VQIRRARITLDGRPLVRDNGTYVRALAALRVMPDVQGVDDQPAPVEAAEVEILVDGCDRTTTVAMSPATSTT
jgi:hypothetical protein